MQDYDLTPDQMQETGFEEEAVELDLSSGVEGVEALASELENTAEGFNVSDYKCVKCGLVHGHDTDKHRASDSFSMSHEDAGNMDFNPNCHCGYNEIANRGEKYGVSNGPSPASAADTAPVPPRVEKQLRG